jgi:hypothetical protein
MGTARVCRQRLRSHRVYRYLRDISALRDVEGVRQCSHYVMGGLLGQQKVSYGWVAGTAGTSVQQTAEEQ